MVRLRALVATVVMSLAFATSAPAAVMIGNASTVVREVKSTFETKERVLIVDDDVFQDEEVTTGSLSAARLIFKDGTNMSMGAQSRLKLTKVLFDPDPSKSKVAMRAAIGVFRMATGNLPSSAYQVATPVATISVRGTIIEFTITGTGTTTVYVAKGAATVRSNNGTEVDLEVGQSTTVRAEGVDGDILAMSPTDPNAPPDDFARQMRAMTVTIRSEEPQTDVQPGGGFNNFRNGPVFNPFPPPPPPRGRSGGSGGGGGGGGSSGGLGGGSGGNGQTNVSTPQTTTPSGSDTGGSPGVDVKAQGPTYARAGTAAETSVVITRVGSGAEAIVGTLEGLTADPANGKHYAGSGSGPNGVSVGPGQSAQFNYQFAAPKTFGTYSANVGFDFPGLNVNGTIQLATTVVGPVLKVEGATNGSIAVPHALGGDPFSHNIRIINDALNVGELELVGLTIKEILLGGAGSQYFSLSFSDADGVLGAGEEGILTLTYDPDQASSLAALMDADGGLVLRILTDVNAAFGEDGAWFEYRLRFGEFVEIEIAAPPVGLALLLGGGLLLIARPRRQYR